MTLIQRVVFFAFIMSIYQCSICKCDGDTEQSGEPLYLTPYLKSGNIPKARDLSLVKDLPDAPEILSYSGFFTVNETYNSNLFFWFVPAMDGNKTAPVLLWLNGGPGESSLLGFFFEHGPYFLHSNMSAGLRKYSWSSRFNMIYVDSPVGAGFSFTDNDDGYAKNEDDVANNMYELLQQFFVIFHEYQENEFYITGESYAGKYVPAISYKIYTEGENSKINLKGMVIGNGLCDPENMISDLPEYYYQLGLVDRTQANFMRNQVDITIQHIQAGDYDRACEILHKLIFSNGSDDSPGYLGSVTGFTYLYNYLFQNEPADYNRFQSYLQKLEVRKAIHVGKMKFHNGDTVQKNLINDIMNTVKPKIEVLVEKYRTLFYNGQLDLVVPYTTTVNFLASMKWKYEKEYLNADRQIWRLKDSQIVAGYFHTVNEQFYEIVVRDSGHFVPHDQPELGFELISRFVNRESFN